MSIRKRIYCKKKPTPPSYISILNSEQSSSRCDDTEDDFKYDGPVISYQPERRCVTNYTPPRGNSSCDTWEYAYFRYLLELRNIFVNELERLKPGIRLSLRSPEFFHHFSKFVHSVSSTYISPYIEPISEIMEEDYEKYLILRNTSDS